MGTLITTLGMSGFIVALLQDKLKSSKNAGINNEIYFVDIAFLIHE
jgi:hypothetical protein